MDIELVVKTLTCLLTQMWLGRKDEHEKQNTIH